MNPSMLNDIPDPQGESFDDILNWVQSRIAAIRQTAFTLDILETFAPVELTEDFVHPCGPEASAEWRRFFLATLLADWACYDKPVDRADFSRLKYIMTSAYRTTRLWGCRLADGKFTPLGYTAWYPIPKFIFDGVLNNRNEINDRGMILPARFIKPQDVRYGYVFNISVARELFNSPCTKELGFAFRDELENLPLINFLAIGVNPATEKLFKIGKFVSTGSITMQEESETLYVRRSMSG
jgi:hypothetical protein